MVAQNPVTGNTPDDGYDDSGTSPPVDIDAAQAFFARRFGNENAGYAAFVFIHDEHVTQHLAHIPLALKGFAGLPADANIYLSVASFATDDNRTEPNVLHLNCVYCEEDATPLPDCLPEPSYRVETSAGRWQSYWELQEPVDVATARRYIVAIADAVGIGHEAIDAARVLRLPGTINHKPENNRFVVRFVEGSGATYRLADFAHLPIPEMSTERSVVASAARIRKDHRNTTLTSTAGLMQKWALDDAAIEAALLAENRAKCIPPLDDDEVRKIVRSITRYPKGEPIGKSEMISDFTEPDGTGSWGIEDLAALPPITYLVDGLIIAEGLHTSIGAGGSYKTFHELDLCFHLACDCETWRGYRLAKGVTCLYVAAEGRGGILKRARAWEIAHERKIPNDRFRVYNGEVRLPDTQSELNLIREAERIGATFAVFDTLNRIMVGDENSAKDMGAFLQACKRIQSAGIAVSVLHHMGWENTRQRGSTALLYASDTERTLTRDESTGVVTMQLTRTKEGEPGAKQHFQPRVVPLGTDDDGKPVTSIVLDTADMVKAALHAIDNYEKLLDALKTFGVFGATSTEWREMSKMPKTTFDRGRRYLLGTKLVSKEGSLYKVNRESGTTSTT